MLFWGLKARSHDPFLRIWFLLVPKIGSCEHIENYLPTDGSVILEKTDGNRTCPIFIRHSSWKIKAPTNFAWYPWDRFGAKLKILCQFWKSDRVNTLQMTFRHFHHKNWTLKLDRLNACFQFSEPRIGSLKSDRVNGPLKAFFDFLMSNSLEKHRSNSPSTYYHGIQDDSKADPFDIFKRPI